MPAADPFWLAVIGLGVGGAASQALTTMTGFNEPLIVKKLGVLGEATKALAGLLGIVGYLAILVWGLIYAPWYTVPSGFFIGALIYTLLARPGRPLAWIFQNIIYVVILIMG